MNTPSCPHCQAALESGVVAVQSPPAGFILVGASEQSLQWKGAEGTWETILPGGVEHPCWRCPSCKTLVLTFQPRSWRPPDWAG